MDKGQLIKHKQVRMSEIKNCDVCWEKKGLKVVAKYDGKTFMGPWAYMCQECFNDYGYDLGLGKGQELIYELEVKDE